MSKNIKYIACNSCGMFPDEAIALRLRRICNKLNLQNAIPDDNNELYRSMFSVLGMIAIKLELNNAPTVQREGWVSVDDTLRVEFEKVAEKYKLNLSRSKIEEGNYESARTNDYWWFYKDVLQNLPAAPTDTE